MPQINEALTGARPGETRPFRKTFGDESPNENFRGKTVDYEVTLVALKEKRLPPLDDELARAVAQAESAERLRETVRANLRSGKEAGTRPKFRHDSLGTMRSENSIPTPDLLVQSRLK